jgi:hypothetical protein
MVTGISMMGIASREEIIIIVITTDREAEAEEEAVVDLTTLTMIEMVTTIRTMVDKIEEILEDSTTIMRIETTIILIETTILIETVILIIEITIIAISAETIILITEMADIEVTEGASTTTITKETMEDLIVIKMPITTSKKIFNRLISCRILRSEILIKDLKMIIPVKANQYSKQRN